MALLRAFTFLAALSVGAVAPGGASAQTLSQEEALALAFPGAELERRTSFLSDEQLARARQLAGSDVDVESAIVTHYVARSNGRPAGVAYFDAHRVRTEQEVLMVVVGPDGHVMRVETVSFREPPEYRAPAGWLRQFDGRELDDALSLRGEIATITGATLTANAATRATRRALALHQVIGPFQRRDP